MTRALKVLLVDDEPAILDSTAAILREMGYQVATLARAEGIVEAARREKPDLLLQDVRMPGLDLQALMTVFRGDPALAKIPVLLFSAGMDLDAVANRLGATMHIEKPFKPDQLVAAIEGALS